MKRIITFIFATMLVGQAWAQRFQSGGLYYNITSDSTVEVTYQYKIDKDNYKYLEKATIPEKVGNYTVTRIGDYAFTLCKNQLNISIPNTVKSIGVDAFAGCNNLVKQTYDNAYYLGNNENPYMVLLSATKNDITSCEINNNCKIIYYEAFRGCSGLTSIIVPKSVIYIGQSAFLYCSGLSSITLPFLEESDSYQYLKYIMGGYIDGTYFPQNLKEVIITGGSYIPKRAFYNCENITSISLPNTIKSIGDEAFYWCRSLTSIIIPDSVTSIGNDAFAMCLNLTTMTIPFFGKYIPSTLENVILSGITSIPSYVLLNCRELTSISIPNTVTNISWQAFYGCGNLNYSTYDNAKYLGNEDNPYYALISFDDAEICEINDSCKIIADNAFKSCTTLTSAYISESVTSIGKKAFGDCKNLTSIEIPNSVVGIDDNAFDGCSKLEAVIIGDSVKRIGDYMFKNCTGLNSITIGKSVTDIGKYAFNNCEKISSITIPDSVTNIGKGAFFGCSGLTSITISNAVSSIVDSVFSNCTNLKSLTIGNSVASIGAKAFSGCSSLKEIICLVSTPPSITEDPFTNTDTIFVPNKYVDVYKKTAIWRRKTILPIIAAESANSAQGIVNIDSDNISDNVVTITATPVEHYHFVSWSDGETDNPRTLPANTTAQLSAIFEGDNCTVIVSTNSETFGSVTGSGSYHYGDTATFTATHAEGYHFVKWNDESTDNPRDYCVTNDVSIAAIFAGHIIVTDAAVAATCTATGLTEGSHCSVCGEILIAQTEIPKADHTAVTDSAVAATCTTTGLTEGSHCSVCGVVLVAQQTTPVREHTVVTDAAVAATETSTGLTEGSHCSVCGIVIVAQTVIPMLDNGGSQGGNEQGGNEQGGENPGGNENNPGTAVAENATNALNIHTHGRTIVVENATDEIRVYNAMGALICRNVACRVRTEINVNGTGIYIVKTGGTVKRVMVN